MTQAETTQAETTHAGTTHAHTGRVADEEDLALVRLPRPLPRGGRPAPPSWGSGP